MDFVQGRDGVAEARVVDVDALDLLGDDGGRRADGAESAVAGLTL